MGSPEKEPYVDNTDDGASESSITLHGGPSRKASAVSLPHLRLDATHVRLPSSGRSSTYSVIAPVSELATSGVLGGVRVRLRLWRISAWFSKNGCGSTPIQFYRDLIEMQRGPSTFPSQSCYAASVRQKASRILLSLLETPHFDAMIKILLAYNAGIIYDFLTSIADETTSGLGYEVTRIWTIIAAVQREQPKVLNEILDFDELCALLIRPDHRTRAPTEDAFASLIGALAHSNHICPKAPEQWVDRSLWDLKIWVPEEYTYHALVRSRINGQLSSWDLPPYADCLVTYMTNCDRQKILGIVHSILSPMRPYAQQFPKWRESSAIRTRFPYMNASEMHILHPFIHLSIHLAYRSPVAATLFVEHGLLQTLGCLWLYDFQDPLRPLVDGSRNISFA